MNSQLNDESESSLPTHIGQYFPSSPPVIGPFETLFDEAETMDHTQHFKSEPPATQIDIASRPPLRRISTEDTERPPSAQQAQRDEDELAHDTEDDDEDEEDLDSDPAVKIADFDWEELHEKYHLAMQSCHADEEELLQEWQSLMSVQLHNSISG